VNVERITYIAHLWVRPTKQRCISEKTIPPAVKVIAQEIHGRAKPPLDALPGVSEASQRREPCRDSGIGEPGLRQAISTILQTAGFFPKPPQRGMI
jgi:hypothetical protein